MDTVRHVWSSTISAHYAHKDMNRLTVLLILCLFIQHNTSVDTLTGFSPNVFKNEIVILIGLLKNFTAVTHLDANQSNCLLTRPDYHAEF